MGTNKYLWILAVSLLSNPAGVWAEMVQGQVTAVDTQNRTLTVQKEPLPGEKLEEINLSVPEDAGLHGIGAFDEVGVGDDIRADANKPTLGIGSWRANWIEKSAAAEPVAAGSEFNQTLEQAEQGFEQHDAAPAPQSGTNYAQYSGQAGEEDGKPLQETSIEM